jgi:hypothetical protein
MYKLIAYYQTTNILYSFISFKHPFAMGKNFFNRNFLNCFYGSEE